MDNKIVKIKGKVTSLNHKRFEISLAYIKYKNLVLKLKEKVLIYCRKKDFSKKLRKNSIVYTNIKFKIPKNYPIPGSFNYVNYLKGKGIKFIGYQIFPEKLNISYPNSKNTIEKYKSFLLKKINSQKIDNKIKNFEKCLIFGDKSFLSKYDQNFLINNGISHLFVISGLHISIVFLFFLYLIRLLLLKLNSYQIPFVISLILTLIYVIFTGANYPTIRAFCILVFVVSLLFIKRHIDPFKVLFFIFFLIIIFCPFSYLNLSMQYSFIIVFFLILFFNNMRYKKFLSIPIATSICFFSGIPLTIYYFGKIYLKGLLTNLIAVPFFSVFIIPLTTIFVFIPSDIILKTLSIFFKIIIKMISKIPELKTLYLFKLHGFEVFLWYLILFLLVGLIKNFNYKRLTLIMFFLVITILTFNYFHKFNEKIAIINLRKTKAIIINHNNKNILIDGGKKSIILGYLLYKNIRTIDYLILTNFNKIFLQSSQFLISKFNVKNVYYPHRFNSTIPNYVKNIVRKRKKLCKKKYCEFSFKNL